MNIFNPMLICDFYKLSHRDQYPEGTTEVYSTWTPRTSRIENIDEVVVFGIQGFVLEYLDRFFKEEFFCQDLQELTHDYKETLRTTLGIQDADVSHIEYLHNLGYLPLEVMALPEGTRCPIRVPMLTIRNTDPKCFWLTNYIETLMSCQLWQASTSATIADRYRTILDFWCRETGGDPEFVQFQGHDFSMRGMSSLQSAALSGAGHLLSFVGTDTVPAIDYLKCFYGGTGIIGTSVPATEHSVQCAYGDDMAYFENMLKLYPSGLVSIVSDGYDFWGVIGKVIPALEDKIMAREGKLVIRPDSGDPVKIICGDPDGATELERKGAVEALWDIFGGTRTDKGYKVLDSRIGLIYGDAITIERCDEICTRLANKGFASTNVVYGIGSFTYQYNTRDTFGFALKSTHVVVNGVDKPIFKDPKTGDGVKKSLKGYVKVWKYDTGWGDTVLHAIDEVTLDESRTDTELVPYFRDGQVLWFEDLQSIRARLREVK